MKHEQSIQVEDSRYAVLRIDPDAKTFEVELPGNYDLQEFKYLTDDATLQAPGQKRVVGTLLAFKRNTKRKGLPKGVKKRG